jgi:hypothetical protein
MRTEIIVRIRLFSGIHRDIGLTGYDSASGIEVRVKKGTLLRTALRRVGFSRLSGYVFFRGGERISPWRSLKDGDEVSCLKPSGGG